MTRITILYPKTESSTFDIDYYLETHIPMSRSAFGDALRGFSVEVGQMGGGMDVPAPYAVICNFLFDSVEAFLGLFMPNAEALQGDIPKFTNVAPVIQISEVVAGG